MAINGKQRHPKAHTREAVEKEKPKAEEKGRQSGIRNGQVQQGMWPNGKGRAKANCQSVFHTVGM